MLTKQELELFDDARATDNEIKRLIPDWIKYREDSKIDVRDSFIDSCEVSDLFSRKALTLEDHYKHFREQFEKIGNDIQHRVKETEGLIIDVENSELEIYTKKPSTLENVRVTLERIRKEIQEYKEKKNRIKKTLEILKDDKELLEDFLKGIKDLEGGNSD